MKLSKEEIKAIKLTAEHVLKYGGYSCNLLSKFKNITIVIEYRRFYNQYSGYWWGLLDIGCGMTAKDFRLRERRALMLLWFAEVNK